MKLEAVNLTKLYKGGKNKALDSFSHTFSEGIYGLLGPNGAGKSTLMNIITDNVKLSEGALMFNGVNHTELGKEYRKIIGYMPQQQGLYPGFTVRHFLSYIAELKGLNKNQANENIDELISNINLKEIENNRIGSLSGGMKQRVLLAQALLGDPQIVILDEPTAGLDPKERIRMRNLISAFSLNKIVIIATHVVSDVEMIAKEIIMLNKGHIELSGDVDSLCKTMKGKVYEVYCKEECFDDICKSYLVSNIKKEYDQLVIRIISDEMPQGNGVMEVEPLLEDVFLACFKEESGYEVGAIRNKKADK